jgi:hypothetical protein
MRHKSIENSLSNVVNYIEKNLVKADSFVVGLLLGIIEALGNVSNDATLNLVQHSGNWS